MKQRITFRPEALLEVEEAIDWYEFRSKGLGTEFLRAFEAILAGITRHPELLSGRLRLGATGTVKTPSL